MPVVSGVDLSFGFFVKFWMTCCMSLQDFKANVDPVVGAGGC